MSLGFEVSKEKLFTRTQTPRSDAVMSKKIDGPCRLPLRGSNSLCHFYREVLFLEPSTLRYKVWNIVKHVVVGLFEKCCSHW